MILVIIWVSQELEPPIYIPKQLIIISIVLLSLKKHIIKMKLETLIVRIKLYKEIRYKYASKKIH